MKSKISKKEFIILFEIGIKKKKYVIHAEDKKTLNRLQKNGLITQNAEYFQLTKKGEDRIIKDLDNLSSFVELQSLEGMSLKILETIQAVLECSTEIITKK